MNDFSPESFEKKDLPFVVNRLSPSIGGEILGIDLSQPLDKKTKDLIYEALLVYKVIFFRDQNISTEQHIEFSKNFGELEIHPFAPKKDLFPEVLVITHNEKSRGRENTWHSDVTWRLEPSLGSVLRMIEKPDHGGDTLFADMYAAYEGLTDEIKEKDYQSFDGPAKFIKDIPKGWKTFNLFNEGVLKGKPSSTGITLLQKKV